MELQKQQRFLSFGLRPALNRMNREIFNVIFDKAYAGN